MRWLGTDLGRSLRTAAAACLVLSACTDGGRTDAKSMRSAAPPQGAATSRTPEPVDQTADTETDDGGTLEVVEVIPMSLLDFAFAASVRSALGTSPQAAMGERIPPESLSKTIGEGQSGLTAAIGVTPFSGSADILRIIGYLDLVRARIEGVTELRVPLRDGRGVASFKHGDVFLRAEVDATEAQKKLYVVEFFALASATDLERRTRYELTVEGDAQVAAGEIHIRHVEDHDQRREFIDFHNNGETAAFYLDFGSPGAPADGPRRVVISGNFPVNGAPGALTGTQGWGVRPPTLLQVAPRYYYPQEGDADVYSVAFTSTLDGDVASASGFLPFRAAAAASTGREFFQTWGYQRHMNDFLLRLVRDPVLNPDCAKTGGVFRQVLAAKGATGLFLLIPDDLCASSPVPNDAVLAAGVEICTRRGDVSIQAHFAPETIVEISLCEKAAEVAPLRDIGLYRLTDGKAERIDPSVASPAHRQLENLITGPTAAEIESAAMVPGFDVPVLPSSAFATATILP